MTDQPVARDIPAAGGSNTLGRYTEKQSNPTCCINRARTSRGWRLGGFDLPHIGLH